MKKSLAGGIAQALRPRRIITRGVIDMATSEVLESVGYFYSGPMALADESTEDKIKKAMGDALGKHLGTVKENLTEFERQMKDNGRITEELKAQIAKSNTDGAKLFAEAAELQRKADARILELEQSIATMAAARSGGGQPGRKSVGQTFIESAELKEFLPAGRAPSKGSSRPVFVKNITSLIGSGGTGIFPEYLPTPVIPAFQPLTVKDLLGQGTTESNSIIWVQENVFTNNAAYQGSDGALKAQSDITYDLVTINVATIGHWMRASKQVLADFKMLQTLIDARLTFGLALAEERELLYGDGAAGHIHGLWPQATAYSTAQDKAGDQMLDVIRHAMLQVTLAFYPATGIALSPVDWHDIELLKDTLHRYIFANPQGVAPAMIWGLPVAQCYSMGAGDFLVGALKLAATVFDREQASILVSTEDQDNFVRNLVTILSEERLALAVSRPKAIIKGTFGAGTSA